jgi:hypothetical protein
MYFEQTTNGIEYTEALVSSEGAGFTLYTTIEHTPNLIKEALAEIRRQRDVVYIRLASEEGWNERYRDEIFRHPLTRPLRWFEINADTPQVLRYHRLKGTTVDQYVSRFVLPCTFETKARNLKRYGKSILDY